MQDAGRARRSRAGAPRGGIGRAGAGARGWRGGGREERAGAGAGARAIGRWLKILHLRTISGTRVARSASLAAILRSKSESLFTYSGPDKRAHGANGHPRPFTTADFSDNGTFPQQTTSRPEPHGRYRPYPSTPNIP